jgi:hypothetical protein
MAELNITIEDKMYSGRFEVEDGIVTVRSSYGEKSTQQGSLSALMVAEMLLKELVRASRL